MLGPLVDVANEVEREVNQNKSEVTMVEQQRIDGKLAIKIR